MSSRAAPPGGPMGLPKMETTSSEHFRRLHLGFLRTTISRFVQNIAGWRPNAGVYSSVLRCVFCFGYRPKNDIRDRIWNLSTATMLLVFTLPIFAVLFITIALDSGRPVIYKGLRLGKKRKLRGGPAWRPSGYGCWRLETRPCDRDGSETPGSRRRHHSGGIRAAY